MSSPESVRPLTKRTNVRDLHALHAEIIRFTRWLLKTVFGMFALNARLWTPDDMILTTIGIVVIFGLALISNEFKKEK